MLPKFVERRIHPKVLAATGVTQYRQCIPYVTLPYSKVIEIGCADGRTCRLLHTAIGGTGGTVLGVDIGKHTIDLARQRSPPGIRYEVANAWDSLSLLELEPAADVLFVDVGGISSADGVNEALALCRQLIAW